MSFTGISIKSSHEINFSIFQTKIRIRKLHYVSWENDKFLKVVYDPENDTHLGAYYAEVYKPLSNIKMRLIVQKGDTKYVDYRVNICDYTKKLRGNTMINFFERRVKKYYNMDLYKCPILPGKFIVAEARPRMSDPSDMFPSFIPMVGKIETNSLAETIIDRKRILVRTTNETFEFY